MIKKSFILVQGPTGVGKSDSITEIGKTLPIEIVNCDMGQFYKPCAIGTAKPNLQEETIPHHLFDIITEPRNITVAQYRNLILTTIEKIWERNKIPVLVGGSGFYGKSLFFPPLGSSSEGVSYNTTKTWQELFDIDPLRAQEIDKNDNYRIQRAFELIQKGFIPSLLKPFYMPPAEHFLIIFLTRERENLYERINQRTKEMLSNGWIEEAQGLMNTEWETFLQEKKLIGYTDIFLFLKNEQTLINTECTIQKKTRNYAKRQITFWKMFKKLMEKEGQQEKLLEINVSENNAQDLLKKGLEGFIKKQQS